MKRNILMAAVLLSAGSLMAAADPKEEVTNAAKKLADAPNYSWKTTTVNAEGTGFGGGGGGGGGAAAFNAPQEFKTQKDGLIYSTRTFNDTTTETVFMGTNGARNRGEGWQTFAEIAANAGGGGGGRRGGGFGLGGGNTSAATQAQDLVKGVKEMKESGGAFVGDLTEEAAKAQAVPNFGGARRGGGGGGGNFTPPEVTGAKGSVRFWVKDGALSKYELKVQGKMTFGENEITIDRTTTTEIKDVGTTKINVPADVVSKLK